MSKLAKRSRYPSKRGAFPLLRRRAGSGFLVFFILNLLSSCTTETPQSQSIPQIGFYHWQQRLEPDSLPLYLLDEQSPELITRCFDVDLVDGQAQATSVVNIAADSLPFRLVPIIFITNRVMQQQSEVSNGVLIDNIVALLADLLTPYNYRSSYENEEKQSFFPYQELQIDCDWTVSTKDTYFNFLQQLRTRLPSRISLTATIRLHQFRDRKTQGIPPVDRGVLMAYNVGNLNEWDTENSQLDTNIIAAYLQRQLPYPIPLDLALPHYTWGVVYRGDKLTYLINELAGTELTDSSRFKQIAPNRYRVRQSTYLDGYYLYADDLIRLEGPHVGSLKTVANQLKKAVPSFSGQRWMFYRIGSKESSVQTQEWFEELVHQ